MKSIKVLVTACGCPGASTLIRMLRKNGEREIEIVGVDMDEEAVGRFLADRFYVVPPAARADAYLERMLEIVQAERPDALLPESSMEVPLLAEHKGRFEALGAAVLVSDPKPMANAVDKYRMYEALNGAGLPLPEYRYPRSVGAFVQAVHELGYPERAVCFKPHVAKGSRGFRILDRAVDRKRQLLELKPNARYMSLVEFLQIFRHTPAKDFPKLLVMEYLEGGEEAADCLCLRGEALVTTVKTVEQARWGVIVRGELVRRPALVEQTRRILERIPLSYCVNLQFIGGKLIEINPRVSTFVYQDDYIAPYVAVKLALGEITKEEAKAYQERVAYGRRLVRYMDCVMYRKRE